MSDPFVAEIKMFGGNFAPRGYAYCDGRILPIAQNTALFSLIGTTFGGDGRTTTALPNLQGRSPMHPGRGPGLTPRKLGERGGETAVTLNANQMPQHNHQLVVTTRDGRFADPTNNLVGAGTALFTETTPNSALAAESLPEQGANESHTNRQPYLAISFIISLQGTYPSRS